MSRLVTGEFCTRQEAQHAIGELLRAGIPMSEIHLERELPSVGFYRRHCVAQTAAEAERRNAGMLTGGIVGGIGGGVCGLLAAMGGMLTTILNMVPQAVRYPTAIPIFASSMLVGALAGALLGGAFGWRLDRTLTRMGAGPSDPGSECLVTVWAADGEVERVETILARTPARHVLAGID